jgi:hypothetical protein
VKRRRALSRRPRSMQRRTADRVIQHNGGKKESRGRGRGKKRDGPVKFASARAGARGEDAHVGAGSAVRWYPACARARRQRYKLMMKRGKRAMRARSASVPRASPSQRARAKHPASAASGVFYFGDVGSIRPCVASSPRSPVPSVPSVQRGGGECWREATTERGERGGGGMHASKGDFAQCMKWFFWPSRRPPVPVDASLSAHNL